MTNKKTNKKKAPSKTKPKTRKPVMVADVTAHSRPASSRILKSESSEGTEAYQFIAENLDAPKAEKTNETPETRRDQARKRASELLASLSALGNGLRNWARHLSPGIRRTVKRLKHDLQQKGIECLHQIERLPFAGGIAATVAQRMK